MDNNKNNSQENASEFYSRYKNFYIKKYWDDNNGENFYRPNGFSQLPEKNYMAFVSEIDKDGKILDLGCGNGLMLKYLEITSGYKIVPYGIDFMEKSIKQAKEVLHSKHASNFEVGNIKDYSFKKGPFDFIFAILYHVHPDDRNNYLNKLKNNSKKGGKVIFYEYLDVLNLKKYDWVGQFPEIKGWKLDRKDYSGLSVAVWEK